MPLYNEAKVVGDVIREALLTFPHLVAVDDGSTDGSADIASAAGADIVQHPINLGQGAALQTGIDYALQHGARWIVTFDADGQHRPQDAAAMVALGDREDVPVILGSRFMDESTDTGLLKRVVLKAAVALTNATTGLRLTDAHNGLRALRRDAAGMIEMQQARMAHASEIIAQIAATGLPYREFPVKVLYTEYSRSKGQSILNSVNILVELWFK